GIRDLTVTGVQTCALPICRRHVLIRSLAREPRLGLQLLADQIEHLAIEVARGGRGRAARRRRRSGSNLVHLLGDRVAVDAYFREIGRASCRERGYRSGGGG